MARLSDEELAELERLDALGHLERLESELLAEVRRLRRVEEAAKVASDAIAEVKSRGWGYDHDDDQCEALSAMEDAGDALLEALK